MAKKKYYVVVHGHQPGLYYQWFGEDGAADQVKGVPDARYKGFYTLQEARDWLLPMQDVEPLLAEIESLLEQAPEETDAFSVADYRAALDAGKVVIFTDGGCDPNPGPGGYGAVLLFQDAQGKTHRRELAGGFRLTTNNRMELRACIEGLKALKHALPVVVYSDSKYVVAGITEGWARRWRDQGWYRTETELVENADLWAELLDLCEKYLVDFRWVRGHTGVPENERCDQLATQAARRPNLPPDIGHEL